MKKLFTCFTIFVIMLNILSFGVRAENSPVLSSKSAMLIDAKTGKQLFSHNANEKIAPGGFAKIMTAIVAIECMLDSDESVVADAEVLAAYDYSFGNMGILPGEILTLDNLINGMILYDAGDAAEVIASYSMESRNEFIKKMNSKAVDIGALNTKFTNPTGFPDEKQYTTVEDICKITKYAMELDYFREIAKKHRYEMNPTNKYKQTRYLDNKNKFLSSVTTDKYYTIRAKGVKTSYIDDNNCGVILWYETDNSTLLSIVAGASYNGETNFSYEDTNKLIDYGLNFYTNVKVISAGDILAEVELINGKDTDRILLEATEDVYINLPKNYDEDKLTTSVVLEKDIKAPISKGKFLGKVTVMYNDEEYISAPLTAPKEVLADNVKGFFVKTIRFLTQPALLVGMGIVLIIIVWSALILGRKKTYKIDKHK